MALPVLEHNFYPAFDAYGVQTFDLILVCDLPFTLNTHYPWHSQNSSQSVPSILAEDFTQFEIKEKINTFFLCWKSRAMGPAIWVMKEKAQQGIW